MGKERIWFQEGHRGTSKPAPVIPMTDGPQSALSPAPSASNNEGTEEID